MYKVGSFDATLSSIALVPFMQVDISDTSVITE